MTHSRRSFLQTMGLGAGASVIGGARLFAARGREALGALPPWARDAAYALAAPSAAIRAGGRSGRHRDR